MAGDSSRRVNIEVPKQYYISDEIWKDLEEYLFSGFLSSPAKLPNAEFVFKTLNHSEIRNIGYLRGNSDSKFRGAFIAHSMFIAMGKNVLHDRADHIDKLIRIAEKIPTSQQDKIFDNLNSLNKRASRLYPLVEAYVHESRSRYRWLYLKRVPIHSIEATGIPGTFSLGMNYCQQSWVAMNEIIDKKDDTEISWNHAKFIGSCFAGRGMASIDEQDKARRNREQQEIEEKKMQILRAYIAQTDGKEIDSDEGVVSLPDGRKATVEGRFKAESVEELAEQLSASLSGEKDWHDKIVEEHFRRERERQLALEKQNKQVAASQRNRVFEAGEPISGSSTVLSRDSAEEYVKRMQALMINNAENHVSPPDIDDSMDRSSLRGDRNG